MLEQGAPVGNGNGHHAAAAVPARVTAEEPAIWDLAKNGNGTKQAPQPTAPRPAAIAAPTPPPLPRPTPFVTAAPAAPVVQAAPVVPVAAAVQADDRDLTAVFLEIVSEKTGYPTEMLELDMDMEADLGIDSIKRVEILGAVREQYPDLPKVDPEAFAEMRSLRQVIDHVKKTLPASGVTPAPVQAQAAAAAFTPTAPVTAQPAAASAETGLAEGVVKEAFLATVSDKTGYPVEMLELDMDMEADLGIDSIKRVEILGAVRDQHPNLPKLAPEAFAELRTLRQIISAYSAPEEAAPKQPAVPAAVVETAKPPADSTSSELRDSAPALEGGQGFSVSFLGVVSEKTGYPTEMLELDMDMEADLGIDSIKRVEIIGAMREQYPNLPKVEPEAFAEMRTLRQVIDHLEGSLSPFLAALAETGNGPEEVAEPGIQRGVVTLKTLPEPDRLETTIADGHVTLLTDDGTELTTRLAAELAQLGLRPVVLSFPQNVAPGRAELPEGVQRVALSDMSEAHLQQCLEEAAAQYGPAAVVIHLNPVFPAEVGGLFSETEKAIVKQVFLLAKHLKVPLNRAAEQGRSAFMTVVRMDGLFGLGDQTDFELVSGGLFGLVKSLNLEWEAVFCRGVDLSPELNAEQSARCVLAELFDPNRRVTEVGYTQDARSTLVVEQASKREVMYG